MGKVAKIITDREYSYCVTCYQGAKCFACGRPERGVALPDGRFVCRHCKNIGVRDTRVARQLFNHVRATLKKLGYATCNAINFHLVDRAAMKRVSGRQYNEREMGLYCSVTQISTVALIGTNMNKVSTSPRQCSIYIYDYLSTERFMETAAHELGHDWYRHQIGNIVFSPACEGIAEYIASRFNEAMGWRHNNKRMQNNPDPVYGDGYRMIREIARRSGDKGVLTYVRSHLTR